MLLFKILTPTIVLSSFVYAVHTNSLDVQFDNVQLVNSSYLENYFNFSLLRVSRFNRTTHVLNWEEEILTDLDEEHTGEIRLYYNRLNNNQYTLSLAKLPNIPICAMFDRYYRWWWMHQVKDYTNIPQLQANESFCPFRKVN